MFDGPVLRGRVVDAVRHDRPFESRADPDDVLVVVVDHDRAAGGHVFEQLALGRGDSFDRAEELDVDRGDVRVDADVRSHQARDLGDLPGMVHPHLADHDLRVIGHVVEAERRADLVVEVAPGFVHAPLGGDQRGDHFLGRGLAGRAGDADQRHVVAIADRFRELLQRFVGVVDLDDRFAGLRNVSDDCAARGLQRLRKELMSVEALAFDGEEDRVGLDLAGVDDDGGGFDFAALDDAAADHGGQLGEGQPRHGRSPLAECKMQNAECRKSESECECECLFSAFCILHSAFGTAGAVIRLRRVSSPVRPLPQRTAGAPDRPPSPKPTDGAGTRHLIER